MDEEKLNISTRKFLKKVGISSQRNIEEKVREKLKSGNTTGINKIKITVRISSHDINLDETIEDEIEF
tara:strand:+ start:1793 stop:1996 length:204 start_codon:yes stop_codon:yes gene_type:complete